MDFDKNFDKKSTEEDKKAVRVMAILRLLEAKLENIYGVPVYLDVQVGDEKLEL